MKLACFSAQSYDQEFLERVNLDHGFDLSFFHFQLNEETTPAAKGYHAICTFVNDSLDATVLKKLYRGSTRAILLRCAGFNNVDLETAKALGMYVARVNDYTPEAIAEFTIALMLNLNRKMHKAYNKVRAGNFSLQGLLGFTMRGKIVGLVGTGKIGLCTARILTSFGCVLVAHAPSKSNELIAMGGRYVSLDELFRISDIISLHCPLTDGTRYMINADSLAKMKEGVMLINTSRGGLVDTEAVISALRLKKLGSLGLDVYEHEAKLFFYDRSEDIFGDPLFLQLTALPNVIVCGHQAYFTEEALQKICQVTLSNLANFINRESSRNVLTCPWESEGSPKLASVQALGNDTQDDADCRHAGEDHVCQSGAAIHAGHVKANTCLRPQL